MIRIYRAALRLLPPAVREEHGETMTALFADLLADARRRKGAAGALLLIVSEIAALVRFAWSERRRERSGRPRRSASGFDEPPLRHARGGREPLLLSILHDLRGAGRALGSTPGFTFVCVATIALAIGANTAIFSIVNAVLLEPLPYPGADRIVVLGHYSDGGDELDTTTPGNFYDWQARATAFESMAAFSYTERTLATGDDAERVLGALVTGELFEVLRRSPAHGRTFARSDDAPGAERVVVLSDGLARRLFGDPDATGRVVSLGGHPCTVIGVMPPDFVFPDYDARFWVPARFDAEFRDNRDQFFLRGVARLKDGVTIDEARAQLDTVMDGIRREHPLFTGKVGAAVLPMKELLVDDVRPRLMTLMSAVVLVLLIASANVGNLLLARSVARRREIAVRRALGARTGRLIRQTLTESLLLGAIGGIAGLAVGKALLAALMAWLPPELPRASGFGLDPAVFAFTSLISLLAGLAFGLVPAIQLGLAPSADAMREGIRGTARGRRLRSALVVSEVALALMLLTAAGLLVRSFANLVRVDPGFRPDPALTFTVGVSGPAYEENQQRDAFFEALEERLRRIPSVEGVARSSTLPVAGRGTGAWFNIIDRPTPPGQTPPSVPYRVVNPDYFRVLGIPIVRGRSLEETDGAEMRAVVISESVARRFWPGDDPIGKRIYLGTPDNRAFPDGEIVGIARDVKQTGLAEGSPAAVYFTHRTRPGWSAFMFAVRTSGDPASLAPAVRTALREIDPSIPLVRVRTMDEVLARSADPARVSMLLVALFALLALVLAVLGVFGILSYAVGQRRVEMGIRMALGATATNVRLLVLRQGMILVLTGVLLGLCGALVLTRFMESLLFGLGPTDPATFATVALLLVATAALASDLPARRATRLDPVDVLRHE